MIGERSETDQSDARGEASQPITDHQPIYMKVYKYGRISHFDQVNPSVVTRESLICSAKSPGSINQTEMPYLDGLLFELLKIRFAFYLRS